MKCLTNKWREGAMLLSFLLISSLAGIFTACDDIEDEYITDTQLSILRESRTSLNYLLKNSTYGTAPGTYPETGKDILNAAITELDALITRVEAGEELDETTLEAAVAKVNQAIDEFKNSKYIICLRKHSNISIIYWLRRMKYLQSLMMKRSGEIIRDNIR